MQGYDRLENKIRRWADEQKNIRCIIVIGSRARSESEIDRHSDLDLVLFATDVEGYVADSRWLSGIDDVWLSYRNTTGAGDPEWIALFEGGLKCDFVIAKVNERLLLSQILLASPYEHVFRRGLRVLLDKTGSSLAAQFESVALNEQLGPSEDEFEMAVDGALIAVSKLAKYISRGDPWRSLQHNNGEMKQRLLPLMEWHARAALEVGLETWYDGRYLDMWADPRVLEALPAIHPAYDIADLERALYATIELIGWLASEIASSLNYIYPTEGQVQALNWLMDMKND